MAVCALLAAVDGVWPLGAAPRGALRTAAPVDGIGAAARAGGIRHIAAAHDSLCLDANDTLTYSTRCDAGRKTQQWVFSQGRMDAIRSVQALCLDHGGYQVHIWTCAAHGSTQQWIFDEKKGTINGLGSCLRANPQEGVVTLVRCNVADKYQIWKAATPEELTTTIEAPTSTAPASENPTLKAPATKAPTTEAPAAEAVTKAPATEAPTTKAPAAEDPTTKAPATEAPTTEAPAAEDSTTKAQTTTASATEEEDKETRHERIVARIKHKLGNCLDGSGQAVQLGACKESADSQQWTYNTARGTIRTAKGECLDASTNNFKQACKPGDAKQTWSLNASTGEIRSASGRCLCALNPKEKVGPVILKDCSSKDSKKSWLLSLPVSTEQKVTGALDYFFACYLIPTFVLLFLLLGVPYVCCMMYPGTKAAARSAQFAEPLAEATPEPAAPAAPELPLPRTDAVTFTDPRQSARGPHDVGIIAFSQGFRQEPCDDLCQAAFLGTCYDLGDEGMEIEAKRCKKKFRNAEAAFRALQSWAQSDSFAKLDGVQAIMKTKSLPNAFSSDYAGLESPWNAMLAVLQAKFTSGSPLGDALEATGDSFLLFCGNPSAPYNDDIRAWSDGSDGEGFNWLGMLLMILRDRRTGWKRWCDFIEESVDIKTGELRNSETEWQDAVRLANAAVANRLEAEA